MTNAEGIKIFEQICFPCEQFELLPHLVTTYSASAQDDITRIEGISAEMWPYFKMTAPKGIKNISDVKIVPGERLFRSRIYLFDFLPFGHDDMTLVEYAEGKGFIEQSPMSSMKLWRHQRDIEDTGTGTRITDQLSFEPRRARHLIGWFMKHVIRHRHEVLKRNLVAGSKWSKKNGVNDSK